MIRLRNVDGPVLVFTHSGRIITLESGTPTIEDVGIHLSNIPRWAGGAHEPWSVAQHSLAALSLAIDPPGEKDTGIRGCTEHGTILTEPETFGGAGMSLLALWHDAHEFATEDVPPPFKSDGVRELQRMLDVRLWRDVLKSEQLPADTGPYMKWLDAVLTTTEAHMLMHPNVGKHFPPRSEKAEKAINLWRGIPADWIADFFVDETNKLLREIQLGS